MKIEFIIIDDLYTNHDNNYNDNDEAAICDVYL